MCKPTENRPPDKGDRNPTSESLATDTSRDSLKHKNLFARIERYENAKALSKRNADYISTQGSLHNRLASNVASCGQSLTFHNYFTIDETRLVSAHFCKKHLLCPMCARRRAAKLIGTYMVRYMAVIEENPGLKPFFITKTVKNHPSLEKSFNHIKESERVFSKRRHRKNANTQSTKIHSGITSYEVTQNSETKDWHPHSHCIALCTDAPDQWELSAEWNRITGDSYIVDVRPVDEKDLIAGFLELFKYVTKFHELDAPTTWELSQTLKGKRLISPFGGFRGVQLEPDDYTDEILRESLPYIQMVYEYINDKYTLTSSEKHA